MSDLIISRIRTYVPLVIGWLLAQAAGALGLLEKIGIHVEIDQGKAAAVAVVGASFVWYEVARRLEKRWPRFGWMLGLPKQPTYTT